MKSSSLVALLEAFSDYRLAVVGDLMLDRYVWGQASRISQEAPVPVVQVDHTTEVPGGAANVASNIAALGGQATLFGVIGSDGDGDRLARLLVRQGIDIAGVEVLETRKTTVKTRIIGNRQQIVRVDAEDTTPILDRDRGRLFDKLAAGLAENRFQGIIFEDYAKGLLTSQFIQKIVDQANRSSLFTILDPHPSHSFKVTGLQMLTPNRVEAFGLAGVYFQETVVPLPHDLPLLEVGRKIIEQWRNRWLLITLGADGMALFSPDADPRHIPTRAREVFDVSGAGDTVTASFALSMLAGASALEAAHLANHAAGIVVAKIGTAPVTARELRKDLQEAYE